MYAIVDIAGKQYKVEKNKKIYVNNLINEDGAKVDFENVLLVDNDGKIQVGTPNVSGAKVSASVLAHVKADKVLIFKKKKKKGYQTLNGHRQPMTQILIEDITV